MPYLTIHMQSIGLTIEEIALIYLALPFTTFLAPPVTGFLVDKFGRYKPVVIISFILNAAIHHSLMLIPHQEVAGVTPPGYVLSPPDGDVEVWWSPCPSRICPDDEELNIILERCNDYCTLPKSINVIVNTATIEKKPVRDSGKIEKGTALHISKPKKYVKKF